MRKDIRTGLGVLVIIICLILGYSTMSTFVEPYKSVSEVRFNSDQYKDVQVQVTGNIVDGTFTQSDYGYQFTLTDGNATMDVVYHGRLPGAFNPTSEIVVVGRITESGVFNATKLIAPCPSKFVGRGVSSGL